jgi:putative molybdopterin biosynthesis protein
MAYSYLDNMELDDALELYIEKIKLTCSMTEAETIPVVEAFGRVTSEAVYAKISSPHYNACAMDGIAVLASNTFRASDTTPVVLHEASGFVRVDTGDPLPENCDSVIMIEDVIEVDEGGIKLINAISPWQNVRQIGEDICENDMIIPSNTRIEPAAIGALLAGGVLEVKVWRKPLVGLLPTGDEIVAPTDNPKRGEIIEFNTAIFSAMLESWGAVPKVYPIIPDKYGMIKESVLKASQECDFVILNAGSSAGREDFSAKVIGDIGEVYTHGIAIKPGKPTILGIVSNRPVIGVPGYPVSGIIVMEKIVKKVVELILKSGTGINKNIKAVLTRNIVSSLKYEEYVRVKLGDVGDRIVATPLNRGAGVVTSFVKADGLFKIPLNSEGFESGKEVEVQLLKDESVIRNTLMLTGSHDPLIDLITDIIRKKEPENHIASSHVGSMGGIMALKRNEAHMAGIHLLDENSGEYNTLYVNRYLGKGNTALIKGIKRVQGLMVAKNNPKLITKLEDLTGSNVDSAIRYVNRQKGSGTRILLDYLLKKNNMDSGLIYGYEREEFTHMNIAALIAADSADAGLGIYSAARAFKLDFMPICEEKYDFIVPIQYVDHKIVRMVIEILKSAEFKTALEQMGGYIVDETCGEVYTI